MAPVKRPRASSASKNSLSSSKKRKLNSSSSSTTTIPKPFSPGKLTSSKRHKKTPTSTTSSTSTTTSLTSKKPTSRIRKPHKKPVKDRYTDAQLKLPTLNGIIPSGVIKPRGKKKGKVFVEDKETMMDILELVNTSVDGVIQGKVEKNRRLEVIREQKRKEQERREKEKEAKLEDVKDSLKKKRKRKVGSTATDGDDVDEKPTRSSGKRKSVSFA